MTLEILICTIDNGISNVPNLILAPIDNVSYLISWQHSQQADQISQAPNKLQRKDIKIIHLSGRGLSRNRNNAIMHATGDICLIADDDCNYKPEYFHKILETFTSNPQVDLATFKMTPELDNKVYPDFVFNLKTKQKRYFTSSVEIAFRRTSVQGKLRFNELFGLGAPVLQSGEENIFIIDAVKQGLSCQYFPIVIVEHDHPTTSTTRSSNHGVIMAEGAYIYIAFPFSWIPRLLLKAKRLNPHNKLGFFTNLRYLIKGIRYYLQNRH